MNVVLSRLVLLLFICLFLTLVGCSGSSEQPGEATVTSLTNEPGVKATDAAVATITPIPGSVSTLLVETLEPPPSAAPTSEPTAAPTAAESSSGEPAVASPLIIANSRGVYAITNGAGVTQLVGSSLAIGSAAYGYQTAFSPDGRFLAYSSPSGEPTALYLLHINAGQTQLITPFFSAETEVRPEDDCLGMDNDSNRCQAAFTVGEVAWSPDGQMLAFVSAHAGASADVYVYSVRDRQITQLSSGATAVSRLNWSPDSHIIFYYGVEFFSGSGSESVLSGWAVSADGAHTIKLHDALTSQTETVVGWQDAETLVVYSTDNGFCGLDLRAHNVRTGVTTSLWDGLFAPNGVAMQPNGTLLIETTCSPEEDWLLYLTQSQGAVIPVQELALHLPVTPRWSPDLGVFYATHVDGWQLFSDEGQLVTYEDLAIDRPNSVPPDTVQGASYWAWTGQTNGRDLHEGVFVQSVTAEGRPQMIFSERANQLQWSPTGDTLYFLSGSNPVILYVAHAPQFKPVALTTNELGGAYGDVLMSWSQP